MKVYIWTMVVLSAIGSATRLSYLGAGKYPRLETTEANKDATFVVLSLFIVGWEIYLLTQLP